MREACADISAAVEGMSVAERARGLGRGAGGDVTAGIDRVAEERLLGALRVLHHAEGLSMTVVSEEAGVLEIGHGGTPIVVIDPVDGSQNAKRGSFDFATATAVADAPTMGGVRYAFVHDYGTGEEFTAERGVGAWLGGEPIDAPPPSSRLRLLAVEGASPARLAAAGGVLEGHADRIRSLGSLALSLCRLAAGRSDALLGLGPVRSVDIAAAQLVAREQGCLVGLPEPDDLDACPLDLTTRRRLIASRGPEMIPPLRAALDAASAAG
jgi:myo-inositol-1(or 4)-monophosphatase